jgi:hypothetical protein
LIGGTVNKRPKSITIIAWILIVASGLGLISTSLSVLDVLNASTHGRNVAPFFPILILGYVGAGIVLVSGAGILKARNWARHLYTAWGIIGLIINLVASPFKILLIPSLIFYLVVLVYLYRPEADEYFSDNAVKNSSRETQIGHLADSGETGLK